MPGLNWQLPSDVIFSGSDAPILRDDPRLTYGSLLLVDPAHPANPWSAGVPSDGSTVPNLAWREAAALFGSGTISTLACPFEKSSAITGAVGLVERSAKGALHVILSMSATLSSGQGVAIRPPLPMINWMVAHPTHAYYFSLWHKGTRFSNAAGAAVVYSLNASSDVVNLFAAISANGNVPNLSAPTPIKQIGSRRSRNLWRPADDAAVTAPFQDQIMANIAVSGYTGTPVTSGSTAQLNSKVFGIGYKSQFVDVGPGLPSRLFQDAYVEDLTVSGRTYAQVDALDYAEYQKQCLTATINGIGGRYYGDTYTDPATIA